jgi:hypothetical protein
MGAAVANVGPNAQQSSFYSGRRAADAVRDGGYKDVGDVFVTG